MTQDIQILRTVDDHTYVRPLTDKARAWIADYLHPAVWEFNAAGWLIVRTHAERTINSAAAWGLVRGFLAEAAPLRLGHTTCEFSGEVK